MTSLFATIVFSPCSLTDPENTYLRRKRSRSSFYYQMRRKKQTAYKKVCTVLLCYWSFFSLSIFLSDSESTVHKSLPCCRWMSTYIPLWIYLSCSTVCPTFLSLFNGLSLSYSVFFSLSIYLSLCLLHYLKTVKGVQGYV